MKKGFTLIELLAVIVILAIITLIAVPIVLNIINSTKESSEEESIKLYIDSVKKAIARKQLEKSSFNPNTCTIENSGNLSCDKEEIKVDIKGNKPNKGIIKIKDNKITYINLLLNGKYYNKITKLVLDNNQNGEPDIGDEYEYKVNDKDTFNFYVLSINSDNTVNLIMDRNICNDGTVKYTDKNNYCRYKWYATTNDNTYGPITAMQELYKGTKEWDNVPDMIMNYIDENNKNNSIKGYQSIVTDKKTKETTITGKPNTKVTVIGTNSKPLKARLPKQIEVTDAGCNETAGSCPVWLVENITYYDIANDKYSINKTNGITNINGYWFLASYNGFAYYARFLYYYGQVLISGYGYIYDTTNRNYGIRPVITVPKDYLE